MQETPTEIAEEEAWSSADVDTVRRLMTRPPYLVSEAFRELITELLTLVRAYGIRKVPLAQDADGKPAFKDVEHREAFLGAVHEGWKLAQARILEGLRARLPLRAECEHRKAQAHRDHNADALACAKRDLIVVNAEMLVLRRFQDSICWTMLQGQHHIIRRLHLQGRMPEVTIQHIDDILPVLIDVNADPLVMALASDATTFVQVGDLVYRDLRAAPTVKLVEIKTGKKNVDLAKKARFAAASGCEHFEHFATENLNATDRKHYARVKRQVERSLSIEEILITGDGRDHRTGSHVITPASRKDPTHFAGELDKRCAEVVGDTTWALGVVDNCLYYGVYSDPRMLLAFAGWVKELIQTPTRVVNLVHSFHDALVRPLPASFLSIEQIARVLRGEIIVVMTLDIDQWIRIGNERLGQERIFLETKRRSRQMLNKTEGYVLTQHDERLIGVRNEAQVHYLGEGVFDRLFFDFQTPTSLADFMTGTGAEQNPTKAPSPSGG